MTISEDDHDGRTAEDRQRLGLINPTKENTMTAMEHFKALTCNYPLTTSDYRADGEITPVAAQRVTTWALEELSEAERIELDRQLQLEMVMGAIEEQVKAGVFAKYADKVTGKEDLVAGAFLYGKDEKQTALIDALVAAGSHYRGRDDPETGEARFFSIPQTASERPPCR